jgi:hypothetical protein
MAKEMYSNFVSGSVNTTITSGATSLVVNGYEAFPQSGEFTVVIESEYIHITAGAGTNTWTIERAQEGSTAASHNSGAIIYAVLTDGSLRKLHRVSKAGTLAGARREINFIEGTAISITATDDGANDKVDVTINASALKDEASWTRPVSTDFSWVNQGGASVAYVNDGLVLVAPPTSGNSLRIQKITLPSAPYTITARLRLMKINSAGGGGMCWRQSSDGKLIRVTFESNAITIDKFTNETTYSGAGYVSNLGLDANAPMRWIRLKDDNTNRTVSLSADGVNWIVIHSVGRTDYLTADQAGFFADCGTSGTVNTLNCAAILSSWAVT